MFWVALLYSLTYFLPVSSSVGAWTNNLSHVFALPAVLGYPKFLSSATLVTLIGSVLFHAADTLGYEGDWLRRFDHGVSIFLSFAAIASVWYKKVPASTLILLGLVGLLPASLLSSPRVYPPLAAFALTLATIVYWKKKRTVNLNKSYLLFVLAFVSRLLPTQFAHRSHVHSIWHVLAFTSVYYATLYRHLSPDKKFPCKWLLVLMGVFMGMFVVYLSYSTEYVLDTNVNGTCRGLHCGSCGSCSNREDYTVYVKTSQTLSSTARSCAVGGLFGSNEQSCLEETGLSSNCTKCWVDNMHCTRQNCLYPCMWELFYPVKGFSRCFVCDETKCSKEFLKCAGMSRRRAGVVTDLRRGPGEICTNISTYTHTDRI